MTITNRFNSNPLGLLQNFDRLFDQALRGIATPAAAVNNGPGVYDYEDEASYVLRIEIPGFGKDDVTLTAEDSELIVKAENEQQKYEERFSYPEDIHVDTIEAKLENGILQLTLPKREEVETPTKTIEIQ